MRDIPEELERLAAERGGMITSAELSSAGWTEGTIRWQRRRWATVAPGVHCLTARPGADPRALPFLTRAWAGLLHAGEGAAIGGRAGAYLWQLTEDEPALVEVAVPRGRRVAPIRGWRFTRHREHIHLVPRPGAPTLVRVEDVVLDLVNRAESPGGALGWLLDSCQRGRTTPQLLRTRLDARRRLRHRALAESVLDDIATGTTSQLELRYLRDVERAHGLPSSVRQFVVPGSGRRSDLGYEEYLVLVELDGRRGHTGQGAFRDMDRDNGHVLLAWVTLRYGWRQVAVDPCGVARQVAAVLRRQGWRGVFRPCPRCR